jgi:hypothetical protein
MIFLLLRLHQTIRSYLPLGPSNSLRGELPTVAALAPSVFPNVAATSILYAEDDHRQKLGIARRREKDRIAQCHRVQR